MCGKESSEESSYGREVEVRVDLNPVEEPQELADDDRPVICPKPERCILHDGKMWKERHQANAQHVAQVPAIGKDGVQLYGSHNTSSGPVLVRSYTR